MELDQHFMIDSKILKKITDAAGVNSQDVILEIGGGSGNLTEFLSRSARKVYVIELDKNLAETLREKFKGENVEVIEGHALKIRWPKFTKLVANVPYSICEPLIWKLIREKFDVAVLTAPLKFAKKLARVRISKDVASEEEGKISFVAGAFFKIAMLFKVPSSAFNPQPNVESAVISLRPTKNKSFVKCLLSQYDKKFKKTFVECCTKQGLTKNKAKDILFSAGFSDKLLEKKVRLLSLKELKNIKHMQKQLNFR